MTEQVKRNYLEINSLKDLKETTRAFDDYAIVLLNPVNFQLNKFFYKNIGKKHHWKDRLSWSDKNWIEYTENKNLDTYILKFKKDLVGYFELLHHEEKNEIEIAYLGLLEEYQNQKLGSFLLTSAIKEAFLKLKELPGPNFLLIKVEPCFDSSTGRVTHSPEEITKRFMQAISS